jgi:short subunit dehydrogenase-like uncharacterized protein
MVRDKKELALSGSAALPQFLFFAGVVTPLWLTVLLPCALASQAIAFVSNKVGGKGGSKAPRSTAPAEKKPVLGNAADTKKRAYDVVVFGATGFTGKMAAVYLAKRYGKTVRWAIAGRRMPALEELRKELMKLNSAYAGMDPADAIPIVIADSGDVESLHKMTSQAVCVITTAGPFDKYGSLLVESCAQNGTHYCDITGETDWVRKMVDQYDDVARQSGARIVSFCGHDCIPWDLLVLECSKHLKKKGERLETISFYDEINAGPSGGTMDTVFHSLGNRVKYHSQLGFDPLMKTAAPSTVQDGVETHTPSTNKVISKTAQWLSYSKEFGAWTGPFVMAMVMCNCVRRSNALNNYSTKLVYKEASVYPSFMAGYCNVMGLIVLGTILMCPPLSKFMQNHVLPKPGEGPSEAEMDKGFLRVTGFGTGSQGSKVRASLYFPTDPGYRDTAR